MKKILFFLFLPSLVLSQEIVSDTVYIEKNGNNYYIVTETKYDDGNIGFSKIMHGDSATTAMKFLQDSERQSNTLAIHAKPLILKGKAVKRINLYNNLHQQISGRSVYITTALRDSAALAGEWTLVFNGENILGEIQLNANKRFIFNPDNGKVYTISTNLLLSTFTNQITFSFNGVRYDLYKFANNKFATIDNDVRLVKKE